MPPLPSAPEIILAADEQEFADQFARFQNGECAYVAAETDDQTFHLFGPAKMGYHKPVFTLILDRITYDAVMGEYFGDVATYRVVRQTDEAPAFQAPNIPAAVAEPMTKQHKSWLRRLVGYNR